MTPREISRLRLAAQGLGRPRFDSPAAVVDWMTCMQSQEPRDALLAIALRSGAERLEPVRDAFARGEIVRSWPMRGTLHTVPAGDLGWMLALTAARTLQGASRRRKELGISNRDLDAAVRVAQDTLAPPGLTRSRFVEELAAAGQDATGGRGYHLLFALAQLGVICQGRFEGREQRFVLADAWIASPRALEAEDAVSTWMIRYFRSHGPATVADFRWWTKLLAREVAPVVDEVRRQLEAITVDGEEYLMDPGTPDRARELGADLDRPHLLPGFDEMVLGYGTRSATIADDHMPKVVPGNNGIFRPTLLIDGAAIGTWRRPRTAGAAVAVEPFKGRVAAKTLKRVQTQAALLPT